MTNLKNNYYILFSLVFTIALVVLAFFSGPQERAGADHEVEPDQCFSQAQCEEDCQENQGGGFCSEHYYEGTNQTCWECIPNLCADECSVCSWQNPNWEDEPDCPPPSSPDCTFYEPFCAPAPGYSCTLEANPESVNGSIELSWQLSSFGGSVDPWKGDIFAEPLPPGDGENPVYEIPSQDLFEGFITVFPVEATEYTAIFHLDVGEEEPAVVKCTTEVSDESLPDPGPVSGGIGWVSFNCLDGGDTCNQSDYKVVADPDTGALSGRAWANPGDGAGNSTGAYGWVRFGGLGESGDTPYGDDNYPSLQDAKIELGEFDEEACDQTDECSVPVTGWARICSATDDLENCSDDLHPEAGGWDGWVSLEGRFTEDDNGEINQNGGVSFNRNTGTFDGFAWGGPYVGWIRFDPPEIDNSVSMGDAAMCFGDPVGEHTLTVEFAGDGSGSVTSDLDSGPGSIDCSSEDPGSCEANFSDGTTVTLTDTADSSSEFTGWDGCDSVEPNGDCTMTMDESKTVIATFKPLHTLTVNIVGSGTVSVNGVDFSCPGSGNCSNNDDFVFSDGTTVDLTATPGPGPNWVFDSWSIDCTGDDPFDCSVEMTQHRTVTATFDLDNGPGTEDPPDVVCLSNYHYDAFENGGDYENDDGSGGDFLAGDAKPSDDEGVHRAPVGAPIIWGLFEEYDPGNPDSGQLIHIAYSDVNPEEDVTWEGDGFNPLNDNTGNPSDPVVYSTIGEKEVKGSVENDDWTGTGVAECGIDEVSGTIRIIPNSLWLQF